MSTGARVVRHWLRAGQVAEVVLDRPEAMNALDTATLTALNEFFTELSFDPDVVVVVLSGAGDRAFCVGADLKERAAMSDADLMAQRPVFRATFGAVLALPQPLIAAVHGYALGAGLQLALACDIRVFARGTKVGLLEHKYGILPDLGGTQRLPHVVGAAKAKELIWTAARIDAEEAYRIGLCERLVEPDALEAEVHELAQTIAAQPPLAVQGAKRAVDAAANLPVREGLVVEAENQAVCLRSADMREAITAFVEQRAPKYENR